MVLSPTHLRRAHDNHVWLKIDFAKDIDYYAAVGRPLLNSTVASDKSGYRSW